MENAPFWWYLVKLIRNQKHDQKGPQKVVFWKGNGTLVWGET